MTTSTPSTMMQERALSDYRGIVDPEILDELQDLGRRLRGKRIVHVNSTRLGGGVAEILYTLIPLSRSLGLETDWLVIEGDPPFFEVTKGFHNQLQGEAVPLTPEMLAHYERVNEQNARRLDLGADVVIVHDPQPAALVTHRPKSALWLWRCHIDLSPKPPPALARGPQLSAWGFLREYVEQYDGAIFTLPRFAQGLRIPQHFVPPSIDPLSEKNRDLPPDEVAAICEELGVPPDKKALVQVSRFDRFKDPIGVIRAYKLFRETYGREHDACLVLAGGGATDDPEGKAVLKEVEAHAEGYEDIRILERPPTSHREINALQRRADVVLQKSTREGFGLVVTEALWKRRPVVAAPAGGITLQVLDGLTGFLARSDEEWADRLAYLLEHPEAGARMGEAGHKHVRQHFLTPRELRDYLRVIADHLGV